MKKTPKGAGVRNNALKDQFKRPGGAWVRSGTTKRTHFPSAKAREARRGGGRG